MSKVPYVFIPVPPELFSEEFVDDHVMLRFLIWMIKRTSTDSRKVRLKNRRKQLILAPFEFMYGRFACAKEAKISEQEARTRLIQLLSMGYIEKVGEKSTSTFTVYRLATEEFRSIGSHQHENQPDSQDRIQQVSHNRKTKSKDLDIEETSYANEVASVDKSPLSDEESREIDGILAFCQKRQILLKRDVVARWFKKHGGQHIVDHVGLLLPNLHKIKKPEAWLERAQKENYVGQNRNLLENRQFAEKFKAEKKWSDLDLRLTYCVHRPTGNDYQYKLPPENFREMLINCYNKYYVDE